MIMSTPTKIYLDESEMPTRWYNVVADLPEPPPPPLHPGTHQPATGDDFAALFPKALIEQEMSAERYIDIPGDVLDVYRLWRPSPLFRAHRLEKLLDTPARIYYKYEGVSPAGSHKPNTAVPQVWYNAQEGIRKLTTETGAGPVGQFTGVCLRSVWSRMRDLAGGCFLQSQTLPPHHDGDLGWAGTPKSL
jgi:tryptophan synthase beta chain